MEKTKKNMEKKSFYLALKLIAIMQNEKTLVNWMDECQKRIVFC